MSRLRGLRKAITVTTLACVAFVVILAAFVPIQQHILRWRAERLLNDIRQLELRKSTWADAQTLMARWGAWGHYDGECTSAKCEYRITLSDSLTDFLTEHPKIWERFEWLKHPYAFLGGRQAEIWGHFDINDGVVWRKGFSTFTWVQPDNTDDSVRGRGYTLIASSDSVSRFVPVRDWPQLRLHPDYAIGTPDGCEVCIAVYVNFTPYAPSGVIERLMDFDLSCITRRHQCRERDDIMPAQWKQYRMEKKRWETAWAQFRNCDYPLDLMGRDADNVVVVDVVASRTEKTANSSFQRCQMRLVERLKGARPWKSGATMDVEVTEGDVSRTAHNALQEVSAGKRFILLFWRAPWNRETQIWVDHCGAIPFTPENLAAIQRGIDQDYASKRQPDGVN